MPTMVIDQKLRKANLETRSIQRPKIEIKL